MAKIEDFEQTEEAVREAEQYNTVFMYNKNTHNPVSGVAEWGRSNGAVTSLVGNSSLQANIILGFQYKKGVVSLPKNGRMIGLIIDEYPDESKRVAIYSQNPTSLYNGKGLTVEHSLGRQISPMNHNNVTYRPTQQSPLYADVDSYDDTPIASTYSMNGGNVNQTFVAYAKINGANVFPSQIIEYPTNGPINSSATLDEFIECSESYTASSQTITLGNRHYYEIGNSLTNQTLLLGNPYTDFTFYGTAEPVYYASKSDFTKSIINWNVLEDYYKSLIKSFIDDKRVGFSWTYYLDEPEVEGNLTYHHFCNSELSNLYNGNFEYYNLPLTRDPEAIVPYLTEGIIPDDVEVKTKPTDGNTLTPDKSDGGDSDKEDGNSDKDMDDTPASPPALSPQAITNNNIYWISGDLIKAFFRWFWTEMGDMTDFQNWLDKIAGMFKSVDEAIISLRYYPVNEEFFGGVSAASSITLANTHYGENLNAQKVNSTTPNIVDIGTYTINEHYKSFCDYSPYTHIKLYLPLHGWIDLDTNLFMGTKLKVQGAFDIMSSTIQYLIYANSTLINTVDAHINTTVSFNLQNFSERQTAVVNNVSNLATGLLSTAVNYSNPIGMGNGILNTLNSANNPQGASLKTYGSMGEMGSLYAYPKCVIYIQRPSYNRPDNYGKHVGYPCNKKYKLSSLNGFTTCVNPQIDFTYEDIKPLQSEVEEIYSLLEGGIIL